MSEGLNRVILLGNLGSDPELRMTNGGTSVLNMRLATSETYLDASKQRQERTEWHRLVVWGKRAEALGKILAKGSRILVEGSLRTTSYDDKDGKKVYQTQIVVSDVKFAGGRGESGAAPSGGGRPSGGGGYEDADYGGGGSDDDIPF